MAKYTFDKEDVRQHLTMQQDIINRMASNSSNCKAWLVAIIAAMTALQISKSTVGSYGWILIVITVIFWILDAFYLGLERIHRDNEKAFVKELETTDVPSNIYTFSTERQNKFCATICAMLSASCWPFYLVFVAASVVIMIICK